MEIVFMKFQRSTGDFLGYSYVSIGEYSLADTHISIYNVTTFSHSFDGAEWIEDAEYLSDKESFFQIEGKDLQSNKELDVD